MKLKCIKCGIEKDISKGDIDKINSLAEDGQVSSAISYLEIFNVTRGKCAGQKKHTFVFEESFLNDVQGLIKRRVDILFIKDNDKKELSKMIDEVRILENRLKSLNEKKESLVIGIEKADTDTENILQEFEKLTGDKRIDLWV